MQTKLTLRIDEKLIKKAKLYSKKSGKSVSQMVTDYFVKLTDKTEHKSIRLPPSTKRLLGILNTGKMLTEKDYKKYLEDKYL